MIIFLVILFPKLIHMVTHYLSNQTKIFSGFDRFSRFALIGNNIDGRVNVGVMDFANYLEAISILPGVFSDLKFEGEWNLSFYQVPDDFKIKHLYGYYKVPKKGRRVFDFGYMMAGDQNEIFLTPALIHITCNSKHIEEKWDDDEEHLDFDIYEEFYTTLLKEDLDRKSFRDEEYRGDITALHVEAWK